ncbi:NAD(P)-dependent dehydrogenase (short-subunit alcohol dehydrogenase family) [Williamsia limnetica]|uniref:NAD(P)-dependent dehydrogenase (Short-subunit alcohol dehydrogenase family) n=1 Tax=Williamsia limnetica TaxID=882452 RepID=A0A318RPR4_WILLI|nr:SDR family oxidoreductase [Williamsia limnetica]PYE16954.1 NAD(P)-dependent dehydrogenase (short-subunit alcohol dehydrogenase family) [Williamsia limnetica]
MTLDKSVDLSGRTAFITGGSRGIGAAIARAFSDAGAAVVLFAKSGSAHATLPGTVYSVAEEIERAGGRALAIPGDLRIDADVESAIARTAEVLGGLDIVVNNAAAFDTTPTSKVSMKRYDLLQAINARGSFAVSRAAIPYLTQSPAGHILSISPPLDLEPKWLGAHLAYTTSKYAVSLATLGLAAELANSGVAANSLWPATAVATEAIRSILGEEVAEQKARSVDIMADAALAVVRRDPRTCSGNLFTDEQVLAAEGKTDLSEYSVGEGEFSRSFFVADSAEVSA